MRHVIQFVLTLLMVPLMLLGVEGCAKTPPNLTPAQGVAFYAEKALGGVEIIQKTVISLEAAHAPGVTEERTADVLKAAYKAGEIGERLATVLRAFDAAKTGDMTAILPLIQEFQDAVEGIGKVDLGATASTLTTLVTNAVEMVKTIRTEYQKATAAQALPAFLPALA